MCILILSIVRMNVNSPLSRTVKTISDICFTPNSEYDSVLTATKNCASGPILFSDCALMYVCSVVKETVLYSLSIGIGFHIDKLPYKQNGRDPLFGPGKSFSCCDAPTLTCFRTAPPRWYYIPQAREHARKHGYLEGEQAEKHVRESLRKKRELMEV